MKMVEKINGDKFKCEECGLIYPSERIALKCEKFCRENKACDLEVIKYAVS